MFGRIVITIICAVVAAALSAFAPVFFNITRSLPVLSLCTAQLALVFMFVLLAFPRAHYEGLMRMSRYYISFLIINFSLLTFVPVPHKLFAFGEITDTVVWLPFPFPEMVTANLSSLITINILSFLFLAILPQETREGVRVPEGRMPATGPVSIEDDLIIHAPNDLEYVGEVSQAEIKIPEQTKAEQVGVLEEVLAARSAEKAPAETLSDEQMAFLAQIGAAEEAAPVTQANPEPLFQAFSPISPQQQASTETLGSVYNSERSNEPATKEQLEHLEQTLLNNIDFKIEEALVINTNGQGLEDTVFHWHSGDKQRILKIFERYNKYAEATEMGGLCQLAFKQGRDWYMISKYQGSYLVLKTSHPEPAPVLETTYRVLTAV
jgi:hypothetical protein